MTIGSGWELIEGDCLAVMRAMPDNSVDLIATDPPYFRVKGEAWDNQWESADRFLAWMGELAEQWQRILRPNGSLYVFASPKMASRVECEIAKRFAILNNLIWVKDSAIHRRACKEELRAFFPQTERIIFAEHFGADNMAKGEAGYVAKCDELRGFLFEPLRHACGSLHRRLGFPYGAAVCGKTSVRKTVSADGAHRHDLKPSGWRRF
jgi:adenine-specific DNA-methyltransferase